MKTRLINITFTSISFLILGCSTPFEDSTPSSIEPHTLDDSDVEYPLELFLSDNYKIQYDEIQEEANRFLSFWNEKSDEIRRIKEIKPIVIENKEMLLLQLPQHTVVSDTLAYIANFENNKGFLLLSADKRLQEPVLSVVESGNLEDEITNPGMDLFFSNVEQYIVDKISDFNKQKPTLINSKLKTIVATLPVEEQNYMSRIEDSRFASTFFGLYFTVSTRTSYWYVDSKVKPLTPVEWNQSEVYNLYTKSKGCGGNAPYTGCVATAAAQLMTYWKYPASFDNHTYNWNQMQNYTDSYSYSYRNRLYKTWPSYVSSTMPFNIKDDIARLMERIGSNVSMDYKCNGSSAKTSDAVRYLNRLGYKGGTYSGYNYNIAVNSLNQGSIVLAEGWSTKRTHRFLGIKVQTTYHDGHAWLIDGYLKLRQDKQTILKIYKKGTNQLLSTKITNEVFKKDYIHNNWGWGGNSNGYFFSNSFNSNVVDLPSNSFAAFTVTGSEDYNYQYKNGIYSYIKKP